MPVCSILVGFSVCFNICWDVTTLQEEELEYYTITEEYLFDSDWFNSMRIMLQYERTYQIYNLTQDVAKFLYHYSTCLCVLAIAAERYVYVCRPTQADTLLSYRNQKIFGTTTTILVFSFLLSPRDVQIQFFIRIPTGCLLFSRF